MSFEITQQDQTNLDKRQYLTHRLFFVCSEIALRGGPSYTTYRRGIEVLHRKYPTYTERVRSDLGYG